jgi:hypothetical protein
MCMSEPQMAAEVRRMTASSEVSKAGLGMYWSETWKGWSVQRVASMVVGPGVGDWERVRGSRWLWVTESIVVIWGWEGMRVWG